MNKALLVIDMQEVSIGVNHHKMFNYDTDLIVKVNKEIEAIDIVIYIRNIMKDNLINKLSPVKVFKDSKEAKLVSNLNIKSNYIFDKYKVDVLSNQNLIKLLNNNHIDTLELVGLDGGGCVSLTAIGAIKRGYKVIINTSTLGTMFINKYNNYKNKLIKKGVIYR